MAKVTATERERKRNLAALRGRVSGGSKRSGVGPQVGRTKVAANLPLRDPVVREPEQEGEDTTQEADQSGSNRLSGARQEKEAGRRYKRFQAIAKKSKKAKQAAKNIKSLKDFKQVGKYLKTIYQVASGAPSLTVIGIILTIALVVARYVVGNKMKIREEEIGLDIMEKWFWGILLTIILINLGLTFVVIIYFIALAQETIEAIPGLEWVIGLFSS